jgi:ribonuclease R
MLRRKISSNDSLDGLLLSLDPRSQGPAHLQVAKPQSKVAALTGTVSLNARGFGFITAGNGDAYFLRANLARFLLTGDTVRFIPLEGEGSDGDSREARALVSVTRPAGRLLCEVHHVADLVHLVSDEPCFLPLQYTEHATISVAPGDVVAVAVPAYDGAPVARPLMVTVERNLGPRNRPGFDLDYALVRYNFDAVMPAGLEAPRASSSDATEWQGAHGVPFVTIDGESTRDFDDAVFGRALPQGGWEVQVAIADVSWYVEQGSELDKWAAGRCTSLYLPGRTMPMLPESLSTDRCSLVPGQARRAVVLTVELSAAGEVVSSKLDRTLIESAARLTYTQVAGYMAGKADIRFALPVEHSVQALADVYHVLAARRTAAGRLEFDDPEPTMVQAEDGTWSLRWESRNDAHKLVEELMLLANTIAAEMLVRRYGAGVFRVQPAPDAESWGELVNWARSKEYMLPAVPTLRSMADLVGAQSSAEAQVAASLKIRSAMRPARYVVQTGAEQGGHFSLSVNWYTHFSSPIRRYADLLVHRLLLAPEGYTLSLQDWEALSAQVSHCSDRAQAARLAERMVWDRLKLQGFMGANTQDDVVMARVVRTNQRGLRVVLSGWQCSAWLPGADIRAQGYQWADDVWVWVSADPAAARVLHEGVQVPVSWTSLSLARPAYPELQVTMRKV